MSIFYTADLHLHHKNCIRFDNRPFNTVEEMTDKIIENWNAKVTPKDSVYILGDFSFSKDAEAVNNVLKRLNGNIYLIRGNHDHFLKKAAFNKALLQGIYDLKSISDGDKQVVLCHYPLAVWDRSHYGSIHLYGHVHNQKEACERHPNLKGMVNAYNVGLMNWNYEPVTLAEILASSQGEL